MIESDEVAAIVARECFPAPVFTVDGERAVLPPFSASPWFGRYVLRGVDAAFRGRSNTAVPGALDVPGVQVRAAVSGELLTADVDYVIDPVYGTLCLLDPVASRTVDVTYRYSHQRLDSIARDAGGALSFVRGLSALATPHPPTLDAAVRVANVLTPPFGSAANARVWPVLDADAPRVSEIVDGRAPARVRIVFIGDSVTEGAEATSEYTTYREVAVRRLRTRFPQTTFTAVVAAVGGSHSAQWLGDDPTWDWGRVTSSKADIAVIEFVNDADQPADSWLATYDELMRRMDAQGARVLLTTPPFTNPVLMGDPAESGIDGRPYVAFLRDFARSRGIPIADVSRGWERLAASGIPYRTLLANGINHPDDRGHELAGEIVAAELAEMIA